MVALPAGRTQAEDVAKELEELFGLTQPKPPTQPAPAEPVPAPPTEPAPPAEPAPPTEPAPPITPAPPAEPSVAETEAAATGFGAAGIPTTIAPAALQTDWRMMVHYFKVARFDLAKDFAEKALAAGPDAPTVLALVESPSTGYDLVVSMLRVEDVADVASRILKLADEGMRTKRTDAGRIRRNLERLGQGPRAYYHALKDLRYSGPYVVPHALAFLQDPSRAELQPDVVRALTDIGRPVVLPLAASLETENPKLKETIVTVLGDIGYAYALPALKAIVEGPASSEAIKSHATRAILKIAGKQILAIPAKKLYLDIAERHYYNRIIVADERQPTTDVFGWIKDVGLIYKAVPSKAVNEVLAARACADALRADPQALEAVALWASAMMQMEAELPGQDARKVDPFLPPNMPSVDFFIRAIGQQHLYRVLDRALRDRNTLVAIRAADALSDVANEQFLLLYGQSDVGSPLVTALRYPDQRVRFAAAFALASIHPRHPFAGAGRVVPIIAEALNLEAARSLLLIEPEANNRNRLLGQLKDAGWTVVSTASGNEALSLAHAMPRVDAVLVSSRLKDASHGDVISLLRGDYQTAMTPILVLSYPDDPIKATWLEQNVKYLKAVEPALEAADLVAAMDAIKKEAGSTPLDQAYARATSLRAAQQLKTIAFGSRVYDARAARASLLQALTNRPDELVIAVLAALAEIPDAEVNQTLATVAIDTNRSREVRIAALLSLARAARSAGGQLTPAQVQGLQALAASADDPLRNAAGDALGGLDPSAPGGATMILQYGVPK
jgi:CheY-like chemotaxis protein